MSLTIFQGTKVKTHFSISLAFSKTYLYVFIMKITLFCYSSSFSWSTTIH